MGWNEPWPAEHEAWFFAHPDAAKDEFDIDFPGTTHTYEAWRHKRRRVLGTAASMSRRFSDQGHLRPRPDTPEDMPSMSWDKREIEFHWTDVLGSLEDLQQIAKAASGSQDRASFVIETDDPAPVLFISDWHIGSWGTSYKTVAEITQQIREHKLWVVVLGDMLQMAIKLRNVLEVSDNALPPRLQIRFLQSWLQDIAPHILWATWDNHSVVREEAATGFSQYAELFRDKTVYHSGIGHVDLTVGGETYKVASSHRFRGNSYLNPTHGQMRYGRMEAQDREVIVAGDSHTPAMQTYADGAMPRIAINCGSLLTDSGYSKRYYSLSTHDWMPVVVFEATRHLFTGYPSLTHYLAGRAVAPLTVAP